MSASPQKVTTLEKQALSTHSCVLRIFLKTNNFFLPKLNPVLPIEKTQISCTAIWGEVHLQ